MFNRKCGKFHALFFISIVIIFSVSLRSAGGDSQKKNPGTWEKPSNWPATASTARLPFWTYYKTGGIPQHEPVPDDNLGLEWDYPLQAEELFGHKMLDFGGAYCATLRGNESCPWNNRYRGIHRGADFGIETKNLGSKKIPVHLVADGIYDGMRKRSKGDMQFVNGMVFYHFSRNGGEKVYTSIYCHTTPSRALIIGKEYKKGDAIGTIRDPKGLWNAHVHVEIYTRPVYIPKGSSKKSVCGCATDESCDAYVKRNKSISHGCGIFEDDLYLVDPLQFIPKYKQ